MYRKLSRPESNRLEQRTLRLSLLTIIGLAIAGVGYGLFIGSEAIMLISMGFSLITLLGFAMVWVLPKPYRAWWARYADSAVLALMALLLIRLPRKILHSNLREVLLITNPDSEIEQRVETAMQQIRAEHDIAEYSADIARTGRIHLIEINMVVGPDF